MDYAVTVSLGGVAPTTGVYLVTAYGADPTGVADSSNAIQAAFNAAGAAGSGVILLPNGTYKAATRITIPAGCDLTIDGSGAIVTGSNSTDICFKLAAGTVTAAVHGRLRFTGLEITGFTDWAISATTDVAGLYSTVESLTVDNCYIHDCGGGIKMYALCSRVDIHDNEIASISHSTVGTQAIRLGVDVLAQTTHQGQYFVHDNLIHDLTQSGAGLEGQGILVYGQFANIHDNVLRSIQNSGDYTNSEGIYTKCIYAIVANNQLENAGNSTNGMICLKGANRAGGTANYGYGVKVIGNTIVSTGTTNNATTRGMYVAVEDATIENNWFEGLRGYGLTTASEDVSNLNIVGNTFIDLRGPYAIYTVHSGDGLNIKNNTIRDLCLTSSTDGYGIFVSAYDDAALSNVTIDSNTITLGATTLATTNARGIMVRMESTGVSIDGISICGNNIKIDTAASNTETPIYVWTRDKTITGLRVNGNNVNSSSPCFFSKSTGTGTDWIVHIDATPAPEGTSAGYADLGSTWMDTATGIMWTKTSGSGNTGWSAWANRILTATNGDTSPTVLGASHLLIPSNTGATAITQLDDSFPGQQVTIVLTSATNPSTIADSATILTAGNAAWGGSIDDTITLFTANGGGSAVWREISRSAN